MYADVVHIRKGAAEYFFDIQERKLVSNARLKEPGSYRLKLLATADNAEPSEPLTVTVRYDGSWDSFHAERVSSLS